jgi:hypothetical protein
MVDPDRQIGVKGHHNPDQGWGAQRSTRPKSIISVVLEGNNIFI